MLTEIEGCGGTSPMSVKLFLEKQKFLGCYGQYGDYE